MYQLSRNDPRAVDFCSQVIRAGGIFAANLDWVYTLVGDSYSQDLCDLISRTKGDPRGFTSGWLGLHRIPDFFNSRQVTPTTAVYLSDGDYLADWFGGKVLLRYPVSPKGCQALPSWMVSQRGESYYFQQFSFSGRPGAYDIELACARAVADLHPECLAPMVAARSANYHGQGSIIEPDAAVRFCTEENIELVIHNEDEPGRGSYAILILEPKGNCLVRWTSCTQTEIEHLLGGLPDTSLGEKGA